jgi:hypothetical protein
MSSFSALTFNTSLFQIKKTMLTVLEVPVVLAMLKALAVLALHVLLDNASSNSTARGVLVVVMVLLDVMAMLLVIVLLLVIVVLVE